MAPKPPKKINSKSGSRGLHVNVKTAKNRSNSSARWLARQLNDPYVAKARAEGYRSRAAYKILELDAKYHLFKPGMKVVDLGCAPGGWAQVAVAKVGAHGKVIGCDLLEVPEVVRSTELIVQDFLAEDAPDILKKMLGGKAGLVMSDMAANTTGHGPTDHLQHHESLRAGLPFRLRNTRARRRVYLQSA